MVAVVAPGQRPPGAFEAITAVAELSIADSPDSLAAALASSDVLSLTAGDVMKCNPRTIRRDMLAVEALKIMETHKITSVVVASDDGGVEGVVHLHDLWRTQMI